MIYGHWKGGAGFTVTVRSTAEPSVRTLPPAGDWSATKSLVQLVKSVTKEIRPTVNPAATMADRAAVSFRLTTSGTVPWRGMMDQVRLVLPANPCASVAVTVTKKSPIWVATPPTSPDEGSIDRPGGRPLADRV